MDGKWMDNGMGIMGRMRVWGQEEKFIGARCCNPLKASGLQFVKTIGT